MASEKRKKDWNSYPMGALREAAPIAAPKLQLKAKGVERKVDLRKHCSPVEDQELLGSCNACSIVGAMEYFHRKEHNRKVDLSVLFLFYNARRLSRTEKENIGVLSAHAMAGLMGFGVCEDKLWPYKVDKHSIEPPAACYMDAKRFEAVQYARVPGFDECKSLLSSGVPVTMGCFFPRRYYNEAADSGVMPAMTGKEKPGGGHSLLLVGYDDDKRTWIARNSWGEDYGEKGYVHVPYALMDAYVWHEDLWAVGALEKLQNARLFGDTMEGAWQAIAADAPAQHMAALDKLRDDIRRELVEDIEAAKSDFRRRVYEDPAPAARAQPPQGVMGASQEGSRLDNLKREMRDDQQRDLDDAKRAARDRLRRSLDPDQGGGGRT